MRLIRQRARRRHVFAAAGVATSVLMACWNDQPTSPPPRAVPTSPSFTTATTVGTYSIPVPGNNFPNSGTQFITNTGIIVPAGNAYRARVLGTLTVSRNSAFNVCNPTTPTPGTGTYGPGGLTNGELRVGVYYHPAAGGVSSVLPYFDMQAGSGAQDSAKTDIRFANVPTEIQVGRTGIGGSVGGPCVPGGGQIGAYDLAGSQNVIVEIVTDAVHLVANPVAIKTPQQVTFTSSRDDGGNYLINSWLWKPDAGGQLIPCGPANPCLYNVQGSGTMYVYTTAGEGSAHVIKYNTSMTLDADQTTVHLGDTVTFTPRYDGIAGPAARWRWIRSDTSVADAVACADGSSPCKKQMVVSGTMWAYSSTVAGQGDSASRQVVVEVPTLSLTPSRTHVMSSDDTVTFVPAWSDNSTVGGGTFSWSASEPPGTTQACPGQAVQCRTAVKELGTMSFSTTRSGRSFTATATVAVSPALPLDQISSRVGDCMESGLCAPDTTGITELDPCAGFGGQRVSPRRSPHMNSSRQSVDLEEACDPDFENPPGLPWAIFEGRALVLVHCPPTPGFFDKITFTSTGSWEGEPATFFVGATRGLVMPTIGGFDSIGIYGVVIHVTTITGTKKYRGKMQVDCADGSFIGVAIPWPAWM